MSSDIPKLLGFKEKEAIIALKDLGLEYKVKTTVAPRVRDFTKINEKRVLRINITKEDVLEIVLG